MAGAQWVLLGVLALGLAPEDPAALVERLGAARYAEREAAARALEALGREALPALRAARDAEDPEVRSRSALLVSRIESELMVRPTLVRLDFADRPVGEVVEVLGRRSGIPLILMPENSPIWKTTRVTLQSSEPVTFWQAMDRLAEAGQLQHNLVMNNSATARGPAIQLFAGSATNTFPVHDNGPFRATVRGLQYHRAVAFGNPANQVVVIAPDGAGRPARSRTTEPGPRGATVTEQFSIELQILAEPRMVLSQGGPPKLIEAVDDRDRNLLPAAGAPETTQRYAGYFGSYNAGSSSLQLQVQLQHPGESGRTLRRFRGTIPVTVSARKDDPLVIPLAEAKGRTYQTAEYSVTVHDLKADENQPGAQIELSVRSLAPADAANGPNRANLEMLAFRAPFQAQSQFEIVDAQGRPYAQWYPSSTRVDPEEARMTLRLLPNDQVGPPAQIRVYDLTRAATEVSFEFHDIPMP